MIYVVLPHGNFQHAFLLFFRDFRLKVAVPMSSDHLNFNIKKNLTTTLLNLRGNQNNLYLLIIFRMKRKIIC